MEKSEIEAKALKEKLKIFIVTVVYQGLMDCVFGPFFNKKVAVKKAKSLVDQSAYDSSNPFSEKENYPALPEQEVVVWELANSESSRILTLAE